MITSRSTKTDIAEAIVEMVARIGAEAADTALAKGRFSRFLLVGLALENDLEKMTARGRDGFSKAELLKAHDLFVSPYHRTISDELAAARAEALEHLRELGNVCRNCEEDAGSDERDAAPGADVSVCLDGSLPVWPKGLCPKCAAELGTPEEELAAAGDRAEAICRECEEDAAQAAERAEVAPLGWSFAVVSKDRSGDGGRFISAREAKGRADVLNFQRSRDLEPWTVVLKRDAEEPEPTAGDEKGPENASEPHGETIAPGSSPEVDHVAQVEAELEELLDPDRWELEWKGPGHPPLARQTAYNGGSPRVSFAELADGRAAEVAARETGETYYGSALTWGLFGVDSIGRKNLGSFPGDELARVVETAIRAQQTGGVGFITLHVQTRGVGFPECRIASLSDRVTAASACPWCGRPTLLETGTLDPRVEARLKKQHETSLAIACRSCSWSSPVLKWSAPRQARISDGSYGEKQARVV